MVKKWWLGSLMMLHVAIIEVLWNPGDRHIPVSPLPSKDLRHPAPPRGVNTHSKDKAEAAYCQQVSL